MKPVDIVTINEIIPIFKEGEPANNIEVVRVMDSAGNPIQYNIVAQKGLHKLGDRVIYIQPDYCLGNQPWFNEYHMPNGEPSKSKLGKKGRVKAIKFNFHFENSMPPIYSNGVILPIEDRMNAVIMKAILLAMEHPEFLLDCESFAQFSDSGNHIIDAQRNLNLMVVLDVTKYVADDSHESGNQSGMIQGDFPSFLYKTDEETIENHKNDIDRCYENKDVLSFTLKRDGSSISEFFRINPIELTEQFGICSRKFQKKLDQSYTSFYKDGEVLCHPYFNKELNIKGWFNDSTQTFYTQEDAEKNLIPVTEIQKDAWIDTDKKFGYLEKLIEYCRKYNIQLSIRGELIGAGNKGSGNKKNADAKLESQVVWFGVDDLSSGHAIRNHYGCEHNLKKVCEELGFNYTQELFEGVFTYDQIIAKCEEYFAKIKGESGQIVEGIVIRSKYNNNLSCKYLNKEYDAAH